jgi:uncharacterized membrane protein YeiH
LTADRGARAAEAGPEGGRVEDWIRVADLAGVAVFALSGALTASRRQLDLFGFLLIATLTAIGGGTLRDLLLGRDPVFWVRDPIYLAITAACGVLGFFVAHRLESRFRALLWADALGLAFFALLGAEAALSAGESWAPAIVMGVLTATFGGLARDLLCHEVPLILRKEIYATAAVLGAGVYVGLVELGAERPLAFVAGFLAAFLLRGAAILWSLSLPVYKARPGRSYGATNSPPRED